MTCPTCTGLLHPDMALCENNAHCEDCIDGCDECQRLLDRDVCAEDIRFAVSEGSQG